MILQKEPFVEQQPKTLFTNPVSVFLMFCFVGLSLIGIGFIGAFNLDANPTITILTDLLYYTGIIILLFLMGVTLLYYLAKFIYSMKTKKSKREAEEGV